MRRRQSQFLPSRRPALMTYRCEQDRLTSLSEDLLIFIQSNFLSIKHRVALSAVCSRFRDLLPSIPRLDTFRFDIHQEFTFPRALIRQCHIVFHDVIDLPNASLVEGLVEAGVQDLILDTSHNGWLNLNGGDSGFFSITSLRSLCLRRIRLCRRFYRSLSSPLGCALLTFFRMDFCVLGDDFLRNLLASCPFLETLQLICCYGLNRGIDKLSIHSASLKHLVLLHMVPCVRAIDVCGPNLEFLVVDVVNELHIEAPKARTASLLLTFLRWKNPSVALKNIFRAPFLKGFACLMLNSSTAQSVRGAQNILAAGIDESRCPKHRDDMIFKLHFNMKDPSSTMVLAELMKKCNDCNTEFDIWANSTHIESTNENDHFLHASTGLELINLQVMMPEKRFEGFLSNWKKMKKFKHTGLEILRRRTSKEQFMGILASKKSLFQVSSNMANTIEMKI